jgi:glycosyltransferase involved in cell wall biosynthesis
LKKVAVYLISDGMGGAEQVVWQTINELKVHDSIYLITNNEIAPYFVNLLPPDRILNIGNIFHHYEKKYRIIRFLLNNRFFSLIPVFLRFRTRKIIAYLIHNNINIIHSHLDYALYSSQLIMKRVKILRLLHTVHCAFGLLEDTHLKPSIPLSSFDFNKIDRLIFVSRFNYELYKKKNIPVNQFTIIYNGIELIDKENPARTEKDSDEFEILYVGGSKYVKGYDILVATVCQLIKTNLHDKIKVVVLGPLSPDCDLIRLIKQNKLEHIFRLVGFIEPPDHLNYFKSADILFMPSRSEAMPLAAMEAVALDLPVIASDLGGIPEIIKHGENGMLGNNDPLTNSILIQEMIQGYNEIIRKAKNYNLRIKYQFGAKNMCEELLKIYN